jgi:hypothetical protein
MAMANTITVIYPPFENAEKQVTPQRWNIIQTIGSWATTTAPGNQDIISDLSSGAYEVRLMALNISVLANAVTSGSNLVTAAKDVFDNLVPGTVGSLIAVRGSYNFGPIGMQIDITSTTACVALVTSVTMGGYFYCQIAKRVK